MKLYNKKGPHSYKENKLIGALKSYFASNTDQIDGYIAPTDYEQLKAVHDKYLIKETEIISETTNEKPETPEMTHEAFRDGIEPEPDLFTQKGDPLNRDEPIIRDYVKNDGFKDEQPKSSPASNYSEPKNFRESFDIPDDSIQGDKAKGDTNKNPFNSPPPPKKEAGPADPDAKIKKKSRKKFTKHAVNAVCALAGKGIVWWTTKDITDAALAKAINQDEICQASLDLIVFLDNGSKGAVKVFFQQAIVSAQDLANFTLEEKEDLVEALDDFLDYKKIEINPGIELGAVFLGIMLDRAIKAMALKAQTGSILQQLKDMHMGTEDQSYSEDEEAHTNNTEQEHADPAAKTQEGVKVPETVEHLE